MRVLCDAAIDDENNRYRQQHLAVRYINMEFLHSFDYVHVRRAYAKNPHEVPGEPVRFEGSLGKFRAGKRGAASSEGSVTILQLTRRHPDFIARLYHGISCL